MTRPAGGKPHYNLRCCIADGELRWWIQKEAYVFWPPSYRTAGDAIRALSARVSSAETEGRWVCWR